MTGHPPRLEDASLAALGGVRHGFFTRRGGVSRGLYDSLNCGFGSSDERTAVAENRGRAAAALGGSRAALVTGYQVHGTDVAEVAEAWRPEDSPRVDGLVSRTPGIVLGVLAADCAPVLFADREAEIVGAAHAGWKGALAGILEATLAAMERLGARRTRITAVIGPCIGFQSYEVGPEFPAPFLAREPASARFFAAHGERCLFDLEGYAAHRLEDAGAGEIVRLSRDTCAEGGEFFSYRRSCQKREGDFGRGLSAIAIGR